MRRILIIIASIIVVLGIALVLYIVFFGTPAAHLTVNTSDPFADTGSGAATQATGQVGTAGSAGTVVAPNLIEITTSPVAAGVSVVDVQATTTLTNTTSSSTLSVSSSTAGSAPQIATQTNNDVIVHYIDRESGNVYSYGALSRTLTRISNKTLPGIQLASWLSDGSLAFVQFIAEADGTNHLDTYALPSTGGTGFFLQPDLSEVLAEPSGSVFTLAAGTDSSIGSTANSDGSNVQTVFTTPLTSLNVYSTSAGFIAATKATSELDGYAFTLSNAGNFTPIIGPLKGLTILPSPSGSQVLYSYTDGTTFHMSVLNLSNGAVTALPLATLAEKCVWTSDETALYCGIPSSMTGNLPDDWYQGTASFSDRIWRIDLTSRLATLVVDPTQTAKTTIDAVNLTIDPQSQVLVFRNRLDSSLWAYSL
jgi:hypothetical protein